MTNRDQAIRDVAAALGVTNAYVEDVYRASNVARAFAPTSYAVAQRMRVLELEAAIREAVLHLDPVGWPIVRKELEAQLQQKEGERR